MLRGVRSSYMMKENLNSTEKLEERFRYTRIALISLAWISPLLYIMADINVRDFSMLAMTAQFVAGSMLLLPLGLLTFIPEKMRESSIPPMALLVLGWCVYVALTGLALRSRTVITFSLLFALLLVVLLSSGWGCAHYRFSGDGPFHF